MVNRCICSNIQFEDVLEICREEGIDQVDELRARNICCRHCKLCEPYIEKMLQTGETSFKPFAFSRSNTPT